MACKACSEALPCIQMYLKIFQIGETRSPSWLGVRMPRWSAQKRQLRRLAMDLSYDQSFLQSGQTTESGHLVRRHGESNRQLAKRYGNGPDGVTFTWNHRSARRGGVGVALEHPSAQNLRVHGESLMRSRRLKDLHQVEQVTNPAAQSIRLSDYCTPCHFNHMCLLEGPAGDRGCTEQP